MGVDPEKIVVTSGAQQAIDLAVRSVVVPGTPVIVERPAYYGALNALRGVGAEILEAPLDGDGIDLQSVEAHLVKHQARLIYVNPTFQNPTGQTMSETKRRDLLALARRFDAVILEDDHSSDWRFAGRPVPAIAALAGPEHRVFYAYSFGKTLLPGQRFGFLVVPPILRRVVLNQKAALDLHGPSFLQEALAHFLLRGNHEVFFEGARTSYGERQKNLRQRLLAQMPTGTKVSAPDGGLSFWITLPEGAEVSELYFRAVRRGVAFVPGEAFFATKPDIEALRVSFGLVPETEISEGIDRLCAVVGDLLTPRRERSVILT
jgi:DNA-binding transcriptional MocR family regulator